MLWVRLGWARHQGLGPHLEKARSLLQWHRAQLHIGLHRHQVRRSMLRLNCFDTLGYGALGDQGHYLCLGYGFSINNEFIWSHCSRSKLITLGLCLLVLRRFVYTLCQRASRCFPLPMLWMLWRKALQLSFQCCRTRFIGHWRGIRLDCILILGNLFLKRLTKARQGRAKTSPSVILMSMRRTPQLSTLFMGTLLRIGLNRVKLPSIRLIYNRYIAYLCRHLDPHLRVNTRLLQKPCQEWSFRSIMMV